MKHTLPRRLLEELRLLTGVVTTYPAVHLVLAGTIRLEEMLGESELEGIAQRIALRGYLEALTTKRRVDMFARRCTVPDLIGIQGLNQSVTQ